MSNGNRINVNDVIIYKRDGNSILEMACWRVLLSEKNPSLNFIGGTGITPWHFLGSYCRLVATNLCTFKKFRNKKSTGRLHQRQLSQLQRRTRISLVVLVMTSDFVSFHIVVDKDLFFDSQLTFSQINWNVLYILHCLINMIWKLLIKLNEYIFFLFVFLLYFRHRFCWKLGLQLKIFDVTHNTNFDITNIDKKFLFYRTKNDFLQMGVLSLCHRQLG